jgi:hypothetical protein
MVLKQDERGKKKERNGVKKKQNEAGRRRRCDKVGNLIWQTSS